MGEQGKDALDLWMEKETERLGHRQLTPKQKNIKRSSLVQEKFKHDIIR